MNICKRVCSSIMGQCKLHTALWVNVPENDKLHSSYNTEDYIAWLELTRYRGAVLEQGAFYKIWFFRRPGAERAGSSKNQFFKTLPRPKGI